MICYNINRRSGHRRALFRLQFHVGLVSRHTLTFLKSELDCASEGIYELLPTLLVLSTVNHQQTIYPWTLYQPQQLRNTPMLIPPAPELTSSCLCLFFIFQIPRFQKMQKWNWFCLTALKRSKVDQRTQSSLIPFFFDFL